MRAHGIPNSGSQGATRPDDRVRSQPRIRWVHMPAHSGPVMALMLLLLIAGIQKILDPTSTSGALRAAGLPSRRVLVRLLGASEVVVAGWWVVMGGPLPALGAALLYAGFAWFVVNALVRKLPVSSCGCLGSADTPPTMVHVVMNSVAASILFVAAIIPVSPMGGLVGAEWSLVLPYSMMVAASVYMLYALLTVLPLVSKSARPAPPAFVSDPVRRSR